MVVKHVDHPCFPGRLRLGHGALAPGVVAAGYDVQNLAKQLPRIVNTLLVNDPDPDFQALYGQFWAPMAGVFVLAVVLPVALKALQGALGRKAVT